MAIAERTRPYETLIRHNADGTIGSHHKLINEVLRDGVVIMANELAPEPVEGAALEAVLGQATVAALAELDATRHQLATAQEALRVQGERAQDLDTKLAKAGEDLQRQVAVAAELQQALTAAGATNAQQAGLIAELRAQLEAARA